MHEASTISIRKLKKFTFTDAYKMLLAKCVRTTEAHRIKDGEHDRKYEEVRTLLLDNIPSRMW